MNLQIGEKMNEADVLFSWTSLGQDGHMSPCPHSAEYMIPPNALKEQKR